MARKFIKHDSEGSSADYMGIGHSGGGVVIWAYIDGDLETWTDHRTHEDVLGKTRFDYWRGRYEGFTGRISIVGPSDRQYQAPPQWLMDRLESEFGADFEIHAFNPPRRS